MGLFGGADLPDLPDIDAQLDLMMKLMKQFGEEAERSRGILDPLRDKFLSSINDLVARFSPEAARAFDFSNEMRTLYRRTALPVEQRLHRDLTQYDTPERRAFEFSRAAGDVTQAASGQRGEEMRRLREVGVDPSDPRYSALRQQQEAEVAARAASAGREASEQVGEQGIARRLLATQIGRGWQTMGDNSLNQGVRLAAAIPAAQQTAINTVASMYGRPFDWQAAQLDVANNYINTLMNRYDAKMQRAAARRNAASGLGGAFGSLLGAGIGLGAGSFGGLGALQAASLGSNLFGGLFNPRDE